MRTWLPEPWRASLRQLQNPNRQEGELWVACCPVLCARHALVIQVM